MFKLLKDLTRPPEPLSPRPSASEAVPYVNPYIPRQARGTSPGPAGSPSIGRSTNGTVPPPQPEVKAPKEVEEMDGYAKIVVMLLHKLEAEGDTMLYLEVSRTNGTSLTIQTLSQLNGVPLTRHSSGSFRRHRGFEVLQKVFEEGLAWKERTDLGEEERQVEEVQRMEGVRIGLETLAWALRDRENRKAFDVSVMISTLLTKGCWWVSKSTASFTSSVSPTFIFGRSVHLTSPRGNTHHPTAE